MMLIRNLLYSFLLLFTSGYAVYGQEPATGVPLFPVTKTPNYLLNQSFMYHFGFNSILFEGATGYESNAIDVQLLKATYNNEFIQKVDLDRVFKKEQDFHIAFRTSAAGGGYWRQDTSNLQHSVRLEWVDENYSVLSRGLTGLILYGNAPFAGETVNLEGRLTSSRLSALNYGLTFPVGPSFQFTASLGLIQVQHFYQNELSGTLYTQADGEFLDMNYSLDLSAFQGNGFSDFYSKGISGGVGMMYHKPRSRYIVAAGIRDLSFLSIPSARTYKANSQLLFEGFNIQNIFKLNDSSFVDFTQDSILNLLKVHRSNEKSNVAIPPSYYAYFLYHLKHGWIAAVEATYNPRFADLPYLALHMNYRLNRLLFTGVSVNTNISSINGGFMVGADIYPSRRTLVFFRTTVQSAFGNAFIDQRHTRGLDAVVTVSYNF